MPLHIAWHCSRPFSCVQSALHLQAKLGRKTFRNSATRQTARQSLSCSRETHKSAFRRPSLVGTTGVKAGRRQHQMSALQGAVTNSLVSVEWLHDRLLDPDVKVLDGSWYMPNAGRNPSAEFGKERIPGSKFFDMDKIADTSSSLPHMLPTSDAFAVAADSMEISNDSTVVIYDRAGIFSAPRVWWTFKVFGHKHVAVLNGGYPAWKAAGYEIDGTALGEDAIAGPARAAASPSTSHNYQPSKQESLVRDVDQMLKNVSSRKEVVVDARGSARFQGTAPEPRKGIRGGHIPGSLNVPFDTLLADGRYKDRQALQLAFEEAGVTWDQPITTSCGTGVTASVLALAVQQINADQPVAVYDGSWTEWGGREDTPIDKA